MSSLVAATWVTAVGSAGSLIGFASYVWIMLINRKDQAELWQQQQAQSVSAWLDEGVRHDREADYVVCTHNSGDTPIFGCEITVQRPDREKEQLVRSAIIPPGVTAVRGLPFGQDVMSADDLYSSSAVPSVRFTDSHGGNWARNTNGVLSRVGHKTLRGGWRTTVQSGRQAC